MHLAPFSSALPTRSAARRCVIARSETQTKQEAGSSTKPGYRFDPYKNIWVRDERAAGKWPTVIQTKTGGSYTVWPVVHTELVEAGLQSITCETAHDMSSRGDALLVDVRLPAAFEKQHAAGAVNVPLYRYVAGNSLYDNLKRIAMAGFAMKATERNPDFVADALKAFPKDKKVIVMCDVGGTLSTVLKFKGHAKTQKNPYKDPERAFGRESRSLKACYELIQAGFTNVLHMEGGLGTWRFEGYPLE